MGRRRHHRAHDLRLQAAGALWSSAAAHVVAAYSLFASATTLFSLRGMLHGGAEQAERTTAFSSDSDSPSLGNTLRSSCSLLLNREV